MEYPSAPPRRCRVRAARPSRSVLLDSGASRTLDPAGHSGGVLTVAHDWITAAQLATLRAAVPPGAEVDVDTVDGVTWRGLAGPYRVLRRRGALLSVSVDVAAAPYWPPEGTVWRHDGCRVADEPTGSIRVISDRPIASALLSGAAAGEVWAFTIFRAVNAAEVYGYLYLRPHRADNPSARGPDLAGGAGAHFVAVRLGRDRHDFPLDASDPDEPYAVRHAHIPAATRAAAAAFHAAIVAGTATSAGLAIARW